jgi:putative CocE/NonD family hydrolase
MQGGSKPAFLRKNVAYYVMGAEKWRYADMLDEVTSHSSAWFLHSTHNPSDVFRSGSLAATSQGDCGPDHYSYDPCDLSLAQLESTVDPDSATDQRMVYAAVGRQLVYHSAPFDKNIEITGFFKLSVWLSIDQPDTDFRVSVYDIGVDGGGILMTNDVMRARYRESVREAQLVPTKDPLLYIFKRFMFVARQVKKGHRLRLVIGPLDSIYSQKNYNAGGVVAEESKRDARRVTVKVFHDQAHPSALFVPFGQPETPP